MAGPNVCRLSDYHNIIRKYIAYRPLIKKRSARLECIYDLTTAVGNCTCKRLIWFAKVYVIITYYFGFRCKQKFYQIVINKPSQSIS